MGRTVRDMALLHSVIAGYDNRDPNSVAIDTGEFLRISEGEQAPSLKGVRIGWSDDLGGIPVESEVTGVLNSVGRDVLASLGADVRPIDLDFDGAEFSFRTLRAWAMVQSHGDTYRTNPAALSRNVIDNVEMGLGITAADIHKAFTDRTRVTRRFAALYGDYDLLAMPTVQVAPFPVEWNHPEVVAGEVQEDYLGWMRSCWYVTATGLPAISVPCGFTEDGLPVGIQLVGRPMGDAELVRYALAFEDANPVWKTHPQIAI
jgi:amidase